MSRLHPLVLCIIRDKPRIDVTQAGYIPLLARHVVAGRLSDPRKEEGMKFQPRVQNLIYLSLNVSYLEPISPSMATSILDYQSQIPLLIPDHPRVNPPGSTGERKESLLNNFPKKLQSDLCWTRDTFRDSSVVIQLTPDDVKSIESAVSKFKC